jgi:hypothetical protein
VVVGNPQVADVTVVDSHTVFVSGRGYGQTDVVVLDSLGRTLYAGDVFVGGQSGGRVSVWRGGERTDMACAPGCEVSFRSPSKTAAGSGSSGGSAAPASSSGGPGIGGVVAGAVGQMTNTAAGAARGVATTFNPAQ